MNVKKLLESQKEQYQNFVAAHSSGSFLQSWNWGDFQTTQNKLPIRYGIYENETLVGTAQLFKTKVPHLPGFYVYCPYGPVTENQTASESLLNKIKSDYPEAWFVRFEPKKEINLVGEKTVHIQPGKTLVLDLTQPLENILQSTHKKVRYNIGVANKHSVTIKSDDLGNDEAIQLLADTSKRQGFHSYPKSYYESLLNSLTTNNSDCKAVLYRATYQDKVISSAIMIDFADTRTYLFGGSNNAYRTQMAPYLLHWQAISDAKQNGLKYYDWWGIETATGKVPGFVQFKLRWGGNQVSYPQAVDIVQNNNWYFIYKILRKVNRLI